MVKNPPANAGDISDVGSIPGAGRSPGGGHSNPLQYSYLENPRGRGVWWAMVHGVPKSQTGLKQFSMYVFIYLGYMPRSGIAGSYGNAISKWVSNERLTASHQPHGLMT